MEVRKIKLKERRGTKLTHPEMKFLLGGSDGSGSKLSKYNCECNKGCVGKWEGWYASQERANQRAAENCWCGGKCTPA